MAIFKYALVICKENVKDGADIRQNFCRDSTLPVCNVRGPALESQKSKLGTDVSNSFLLHGEIEPDNCLDNCRDTVAAN